MPKRVSIKDIADKAGVSIALVSYVLNNKMEGRINVKTREKILHTASKLNYRSNHIAKSLKTNKTNTIGLIVADISNPFSSALARIIEDEATRYGFTVIFGSSDEHCDKAEQLIDTFLNRLVDGLIIMPPDGAQQQIKLLQKKKIPFILIDRYFPEIKSPAIVLDNFKATYDATTYLISTGRKRIGMLSYNTDLINLKERENGYQAALEGSGVASGEIYLKRIDIKNDPVEIATGLSELLLRKKPIDALLCASNKITVGALRYINTLPVKIPEQLAIIGFDETDLFDFFKPPLSFVRQPLVDIGQKAVQLLLTNMQLLNENKKIILPAELVIRES